MRYICSLALLLLLVAGCTGYNIVPLDDDDTPVDNPDDPPIDDPDWRPTVTVIDIHGDDDATPEPPEIPDPRFYVTTKSGWRYSEGSNIDQINVARDGLYTVCAGFLTDTITARPGSYSHTVMNTK